MTDDECPVCGNPTTDRHPVADDGITVTMYGTVCFASAEHVTGGMVYCHD